MVIEKPHMSLSIDPTIPVTDRNDSRSAQLFSSSPRSTNSAINFGHSALKQFAPVSEPSPPITTSRFTPSCARCSAACRRPSHVRNSLHRAELITVPPCCIMSTMSFHVISKMFSPPSYSPLYPLVMA